MKVQLENVKPMDIEKRSFAIITEMNSRKIRHRLSSDAFIPVQILIMPKILCFPMM